MGIVGIVGIVGISFDATEMRKTEQQLSESQNKLEGMTLVSASAAHELRTPLASIRVNTQIFKQIFSHLYQGYHLAEDNNLLEQKLDLIDKQVIIINVDDATGGDKGDL